MTTELEQRLRDVLREDAARAHLVNPDRPADPHTRLVAVAQQSASLPRRLVAVAAAIVLVALAGVAVILNRGGTSEEPSSSDPTRVFTEIPPGSTVDLGTAPIAERAVPALVWTGTEMIVWGGMDRRGATLADGAAFDLATGTWRVIAPAPIVGREWPQLAWTGTEMIIWGGAYSDGAIVDGAYVRTGLTDGAAYNPATNTWRLLPPAPVDSTVYGSAVWTGEEVILIGNGPDGDRSLQQGDTVPRQVAAYNPAADQWRRLADVPGIPWGEPIWNGETLVASIGSSLVRYDPGSDTWQTISAGVRYLSLVAVTDTDGAVRSILALPDQTGAPVAVLDPAGNQIATLAGHPGDRAHFGDYIEVDAGVWLGQEALFWISGAEWDFSTDPPAEAWLLNPETGTWRPLDANVLPPVIVLRPVTTAGIMIGWGGDASTTGIAFRPPTPTG